MKIYTIAIDMSLKVHVPVRAEDEDEAMDLFGDMDRLKMVDWQKYDVFIEPIGSEIVKVSPDDRDDFDPLSIKIWGKDVVSNEEVNRKFVTWRQAFQFFNLDTSPLYKSMMWNIAVARLVYDRRLNMEVLYNED